METIRIDISLCNLRNQKIVKQNFYFVELTDIYLRRTFEFWADESVDPEDPGMGWKENEYNFSDSYVLKEDIGGFEFFNTTDPARWAITIMGKRAAPKIFFKKKEDAQHLLEHLQKWLL